MNETIIFIEQNQPELTETPHPTLNTSVDAPHCDCMPEAAATAPAPVEVRDAPHCDCY